jgi:hypothetical protein
MIRFFSGVNNWIFIVGILASSCYEFPEIPQPELMQVELADLSRVVVVGDAYASGLMDGALYGEGQSHSFPKLLLERINEGGLIQANIESEVGLNQFYPLGQLLGKFKLVYRVRDSPVPEIDVLQGQFPNIVDGSKQDVMDLSIPGLRITDFNNSQLYQDNFYFNRLQVNAGNTLMDEVLLRDPTFLILHVGTEDILRYVMGGATGDFNAHDPGLHDATDVSRFETALQNIVQQLVSDNRKALVLTLPDIIRSPLISHVSPILTNVISLAHAGQASAHYSQFNADVLEWNFNTPGVTPEQRRPNIEFGDDAPHLWGIVIHDNTLPDAELQNGRVIPKIRQLKANERVLLTIKDLIGKAGYGTTVPISDEYVLTKPQLDSISCRLMQYNTVIKNVAENNTNVALVDLNVFFEDLYSFEGVHFDGVPFFPHFLQGGVFSSDGFFMNPRGQALISNQIICVLNSHFQGNIGLVNPNHYSGNVMVNDF